MSFANMPEAELRAMCSDRIEALEHWLRRLIDHTFTTAYGPDYFQHVDTQGARLVSKKLAEQVASRCAAEPARYPRLIDAVLLDDAIALICRDALWNAHFRQALSDAFPNGATEARTFLLRIAAPRNNLAHANAISLRAAEQVVCYSNDVIDSLKRHYREIGMAQDFDVPLFLRLTDSFGAVHVRNEDSKAYGFLVDVSSDPNRYQRVGDEVVLTVEVDPAYPADQYSLNWSCDSAWNWDSAPVNIGVTQVVFRFDERHVGQSCRIRCTLVTTRTWHRGIFGMPGIDDQMIFVARVLPPV